MISGTPAPLGCGYSGSSCSASIRVSKPTLSAASSTSSSTTKAGAASRKTHAARHAGRGGRAVAGAGSARGRPAGERRHEPPASPSPSSDRRAARR